MKANQFFFRPSHLFDIKQNFASGKRLKSNIRIKSSWSKEYEEIIAFLNSLMIWLTMSTVNGCVFRPILGKFIVISRSKFRIFFLNKKAILSLDLISVLNKLRKSNFLASFTISDAVVFQIMDLKEYHKLEKQNWRRLAQQQFAAQNPLKKIDTGSNRIYRNIFCLW